MLTDREIALYGSLTIFSWLAIGSFFKALAYAAEGRWVMSALEGLGIPFAFFICRSIWRVTR